MPDQPWNNLKHRQLLTALYQERARGQQEIARRQESLADAEQEQEALQDRIARVEADPSITE